MMSGAMLARPITDEDIYLFNEGTHSRLYEILGAHQVVEGAVRFAVWAPNAEAVSVMGDFNGWDREAHRMTPVAGSGIWESTVAGIGPGTVYKYHVRSRERGYRVDKADPVGFQAEIAPSTASVVANMDYEWHDDEWMADRVRRNARDAPISIYEVHLGSWQRVPSEGYRSLSYREIAEPLADHVERYGFTHVEFLPIMEHPFFGSWGYQTTGYFAPSSRHGSPADFMALIDYLHQREIGVILDWVPSHFPTDEHGLGYFDGTHLYEHADPRQGFHQDWDTYVFNYGRNEVRSFLASSALFWLDRYHADGLRVDAVASMLYLDYSRKEGEWVPNRYGGRENLEALDFLRRLNEVVFERFPDVQTYAEESTAWPAVSRPTYLGGLGFGFKWDMGWMHDTLLYMSRDPVYRHYHHGEMTFRSVYAFSENFVLPLSHDEVVYGKGSLLEKMPGDRWQQFANLRLLYSYMFAQPGKKLLFMGAELAQPWEWSHDATIAWDLVEAEEHAAIGRLLHQLNHLYRHEAPLHETDCEAPGFEWMEPNDAASSSIAFLRWDHAFDEVVLAVFNFTPVVRENYRVGAPRAGHWREIFNSDAAEYGGSGIGNLGGATSVPVPAHGRFDSLTVTLPPLGAVFFKHDG